MSHDPEYRIRALEALNRLPVIERTVYCLSAIDDMSVAAIAARMGLTMTAVEQALARALVALGKAIEDG